MFSLSKDDRVVKLQEYCSDRDSVVVVGYPLEQGREYKIHVFTSPAGIQQAVRYIQGYVYSDEGVVREPEVMFVRDWKARFVVIDFDSIDH